LLFILCVVSFFDMGRHLHWIFRWFFLQCHVPRTTPCLLSPLSHPISKHLLYAHEFNFFIKKNFCFWKFQWNYFLAVQARISAPMGGISGGQDILG
jgi:hypothetical protein